MFGIFARAMIGVVASASPELNGPQMQCTLSWLIISWVAFTALVGSPWVSRMTISILRPLTPPAALMASTAKATPRLKPWVGAEARAGHRREIADLDCLRLGDGGSRKGKACRAQCTGAAQ